MIAEAAETNQGQRSPRELVEAFYIRIWNAGDLSATRDLLTPGFVFRGSLGNELLGRHAFGEYVYSVRDALSSTVARSSTASSKVEKRLPECASRACIKLHLVASPQQASWFTGWERRCSDATAD